MLKVIKKLSKRNWLWISLGVEALLVLALMIVLLVVLGKKPEPAASGPSTVATLPPPPANVFTPADFAYDENGYMTCLTDVSIRGIDVSSHQKEIDWQQVKASGVEFVMIRLAYRGSIEGAVFEDEWAQRYYQGARAAGLKVGGYFFTQGISVEEAIADANLALEMTKDWEMEMPIVYDWELLKDTYRNAHVNARMLTDYCKAFCDVIEEGGRKSMVYFNPVQSRERMYLAELTDYDFWLAMYSDEMNYAYKVKMWQYTCTGKVPGIEGDVDINLYFPYDEA